MVTEYIYEDRKLVRTVSRSEPEWGEADRLAVVAELERRRMLGDHGHPLDEAMSPDADPSSFDAKYRYVVPPPTRDYAKQALNEAQEAMRKRFPDADLSAFRWRVEREDL